MSLRLKDIADAAIKANAEARAKQLPRLPKIEMPMMGGTHEASENDARQRLREFAGNLNIAALACIGFGIFLLLLAVVNQDGDGYWFGGASAALMVTAFWLILLAQIVHIRANTEK